MPRGARGAGVPARMTAGVGDDCVTSSGRAGGAAPWADGAGTDGPRHGGCERQVIPTIPGTTSRAVGVTLGDRYRLDALLATGAWGQGVAGPGRRPGPARGRQGAPPRARRGLGRPDPVPRRGPPLGGPRPSQHRRAPRLRGGGSRPRSSWRPGGLPGDGTGRRRGTVDGAAAGAPAGPGPDPRHHAADRGGAGRGARGGRRPPRREAEQSAHRPARHRHHHRLRDRMDGVQRSAHGDRTGHGHGPVPLAGAGAGAQGRPGQ